MSEVEWEDRDAVEPTPEPSREPFDPHLGPLDDEDDVKFLDRNDPRRKTIEERRLSVEEDY